VKQIEVPGVELRLPRVPQHIGATPNGGNAPQSRTPEAVGRRLHVLKDFDQANSLLDLNNYK
jgi:hypothetical protein